MFLGDVFWIDREEPSVQLAAVYGSPWIEEPVLGWDVRMDLLTPDQQKKVREITDNLVIGELFLPEACAKLVR
jgi:hypothetical protein